MVYSKFKKTFLAIPFVPDASSDARFSKYFSKLFQEIIFVSLHNFLSINLAKQCRPLLTSLCDTKDQGVDEGVRFLKTRLFFCNFKI